MVSGTTVEREGEEAGSAAVEDDRAADGDPIHGRGDLHDGDETECGPEQRQA